MEARREVQIRRASSGDVEAIAAQRNALFRELGLLASGVDAERFDSCTRSAFRDGVERETCLAWLAIAPAGEVVGSSALTLLERLPSPTNPSPVEGYLAHLFVLPAWRRSGVGSNLVRAAVDEARARRLGRVRLHATGAGRALLRTPRLPPAHERHGPADRRGRALKLRTIRDRAAPRPCARAGSCRAARG